MAKKKLKVVKSGNPYDQYDGPEAQSTQFQKLPRIKRPRTALRRYALSIKKRLGG